MQSRLRLRHRADFEALRRDGHRLIHPFAVLIVKTNGREISRFGFSASRRVGKAHLRNRAKRLLREAVRLQLDEVSPGWDCLFVARQRTATAKFSDVATAVTSLLLELREMSLRSPGNPER